MRIYIPCIRNKRVLIGTSLIFLLLVLYFFYYSFLIGSPVGASIKYYSIQQKTFETIELRDEQLKRFVHLLGKTKPSIAPMVHDGICNENILITLSYKDKSNEKYSVWGSNTFLYSGDAEDLTMSSMLGGGLFHFGGRVDSKLEEFFNNLDNWNPNGNL